MDKPLVIVFRNTGLHIMHQCELQRRIDTHTLQEIFADPYIRLDQDEQYLMLCRSETYRFYSFRDRLKRISKGKKYGDSPNDYFEESKGDNT